LFGIQQANAGKPDETNIFRQTNLFIWRRRQECSKQYGTMNVHFCKFTISFDTRFFIIIIICDIYTVPYSARSCSKALHNNYLQLFISSQLFIQIYLQILVAAFLKIHYAKYLAQSLEMTFIRPANTINEHSLAQSLSEWQICHLFLLGFTMLKVRLL